MILVTGGTGFVGSHLSYALKRHHLPTQSGKPIDITRYSQVKTLLNQYRPSFIIHLAAVSAADIALKDPRKAFTTNVIGTVNILEAVRTTNFVQGVIIASSDKVYGDQPGVYKETDSLKGQHPHDASKAAADLAAQSYLYTFNLPLVILRSCNVFGPGDLNFNRLIPGIIKAALLNIPLSIRSNGKFTRDYLYIDDSIRAYLLFLKHFPKVKGKILNLGGTINLSVLDVVRRCQNILKTPIPYRIINKPTHEIPHQSISDRKIRSLLKWHPTIDFATGILKTYHWYRRHLRKLA